MHQSGNRIGQNLCKKIGTYYKICKYWYVSTSILAVAGKYVPLFGFVHSRLFGISDADVETYCCRHFFENGYLTATPIKTTY